MSAIDSSSVSPVSSPPEFRIHDRRGSLLDVGGENSINNFAFAVRRSVNYLSSSVGSRTTLDSELAVPSSPRVTPQVPPDEHTPLLEPPKDAVSEIVISLKSTPVQTVFNSINVLIGLGILSIPLAFRLAGWIMGTAILTLAALSTRYTAVLLGRIQARNQSLRTYHDIAQQAFGARASVLVFVVFALDLYGASVTMVILFADSFNAIFQGLSPAFFKTVVCTAMVLLNALPLRILSFLSFAGIVCTTATFFMVLVSGLIHRTQPGSLLHPAPTNLWPVSLPDLCFSLGLFLAPWGGHAAFPEVYTDQKRPEKYTACMSIAFLFSYSMDLATGVVGFLMFGQIVQDEVTKNILLNKAYPAWIPTTIVVLMGILPLSKLPLVCRPILSALERRLPPLASRLAVSCVLLVSSLLITNFGKIMSLLGSAICFTVCITLPLLFYLRLHRSELTPLAQFLLALMALVSALLTVGGSIAALLV
ncbi:hypothetical protein KL948_003429 [Ogataea haglerorum]|nr:hypothetical protein KL948_003429 [Ogataea haglerorum]